MVIPSFKINLLLLCLLTYTSRPHEQVPDDCALVQNIEGVALEGKILASFWSDTLQVFSPARISSFVPRRFLRSTSVLHRSKPQASCERLVSAMFVGQPPREEGRAAAD
jgi:hypothetical protein